MDPNAEIPKFTPPEVEGYFTNLPSELKPKPAILEPWFKYFKGLGLSDYKLKTMGEEFTVAHTLRQWIMDRDSAPNLKPTLKSAKDLMTEGIDPARLARYLILQTAYPKGIALDNERITFELNLETIDKLLKGITEAIPNMNNLSKEQFYEILARMGFKYNPNARNYINPVDQQGFKDMLNQIINTDSTN